jgi:hypothetical protein
MPTLSQVAANKASITFAWGDLTFHIEYYPGKMTGNLIAEVEANEDMETMGRFLVGVLASWDLTEDDDVTMFPLEVERFGEIGLPFLMGVFYAMVNDMRPEAEAPQTKTKKRG